MIKRIIQWWKKLIYEEYEVTIWFKNGNTFNIGPGNDKTRKKFKLKSLKKVSNTHIKGKDLNYNEWEIKTVEPFDYNIVKIY